MRSLCAFLLVCCSCAAAAAPPSAPVTVVSGEFGVFEVDKKSGDIAFEPTATVPFKVGQRYGWIIELRTKKRSVAVREEYLLPPTETYKEEEGGKRLTIPLERRNQVSQRQLVPVAGRIYGEWSIGPGEPTGKRKLQVIVEDQPPVIFEYEVR